MKKVFLLSLFLLTIFHFTVVIASTNLNSNLKIVQLQNLAINEGKVTKGHLYYDDEQGDPLDVPACKCPDTPVTCRCVTSSNDDQTN